MSNEEHPLFANPSFTFLFDSYKNRRTPEVAADADESLSADYIRRMSLFKCRILTVLFLLMAAAAAYLSITITIDKGTPDRPISAQMQTR